MVKPKLHARFPQRRYAVVRDAFRRFHADRANRNGFVMIMELNVNQRRAGDRLVLTGRFRAAGEDADGHVPRQRYEKSNQDKSDR